MKLLIDTNIFLEVILEQEKAVETTVFFDKTELRRKLPADI